MNIKPKHSVVIFIVVMIAATALISASLQHSRSPQISTQSVVSETPWGTAPDFELKTLDGKTVKLSDFKGKIVALNFWATYCAPCRVEMPWLIDFYSKYKDRGLEIVGVSMDDDGPQQVAAFIKEMNVNYTILMGNHSIADSFGGTRFLPQTFFIDRDGKIIKRTLGIKTKRDFEETIIESLHTESAPGSSQQ